MSDYSSQRRRPKPTSAPAAPRRAGLSGSRQGGYSGGHQGGQNRAYQGGYDDGRAGAKAAGAYPLANEAAPDAPSFDGRDAQTARAGGPKQQVLAGFHPVQARLRSDAASVHRLYVDEARRDARMQSLLAMAEAAGVKASAVSHERLDGLAGALRHQGVVALAEPRAIRQIDLDDLLDERMVAGQPPVLLLILDGVTDPHNLGACLRVADGAGACAVVAPRDKSAPLSDVAIRTSAGGAESVPYIQVTNLARTIGELQERGVRVIGTDDQASASIWDEALTDHVALVLGAEGHGLRRLTRDRCDALVQLPMQGQCESLNVSVAAGICLYEARRQRR